MNFPPVHSGAVNEVRRRLIDEIAMGQFEKGMLPTSAEIALKYGVGTATVNRAMKYLQKEGWVERRAGVGTFPGPRAGLSEGNAIPLSLLSSPLTFRLAVAVLPLDFSLNNWHAQHLLQGVDRAAAQENLSMELIGPCGGDDLFAKRLERNRPDFLAFLKPRIVSAPLLREARRLKIPCLATGTHWRGLEVPLIEEDGFGGSVNGVRALIAAGHRRIGFLCPHGPNSLWVDRRLGYESAMREAFGDLDQNLVFWTGYEEGQGDPEALRHYLKKQKPTALIVAAGLDIGCLKPLIDSQVVRIPETLSIVVFDNRKEFYRSILGGVIPSVVDLPLEEMGEKVVELALAWKNGQTLPPQTLLPCRLLPGDSIAPPSP